MSERRTAVVMQPSYLPWPGYFTLLAQADVWVWYDTVQYTRRDWRNRNRFAADGEPLWLTVPVRNKGRFEQEIRDVEIEDQRPWARKHLGTLEHLYSGAPYYGLVRELLRDSLDNPPRRLAELTIAQNETLCRAMQIAPRFLRSSALEGIAGERQDRLVALCRKLGASVYLSAPAARAYVDPDGFAEAGIELRYAVYDLPPYERGGQPFIPNLSIVDALCWLGPDATASYLRAHAGWEAP